MSLPPPWLALPTPATFDARLPPRVRHLINNAIKLLAPSIILYVAVSALRDGDSSPWFGIAATIAGLAYLGFVTRIMLTKLAPRELEALSRDADTFEEVPTAVVDARR